MEKSREDKLQKAFRDLWRNYPGWPSTFGPCSQKCKEEAYGRGSGPCADCCEKELADLVGPRYAHEYHVSIKELRELEKDMLEDINEWTKKSLETLKEQ